MRVNYLLLTLFTLSILFGCSNDEIDNTVSEDLYKQKDVFLVDEDQVNTKIQNQYRLLENTDTNSSTELYTFASGFVPDDDHKEYIKISNDDNYLFLKSDGYISGKIIFDNATDSTVKTTAIFLQGNDNVNFRLKGSEKWNPAIDIDVSSKTSVELEVEIKWDVNKEKELTFFPLNHSNPEVRYNGGNLGLYRFAVVNDIDEISAKDIKKQSINIDKDFDYEENSVLPIPTWIDSKSKTLDIIKKNNSLYTEEKITAVNLEAIPYETELDIILVDQYGNASSIGESVNIIPNHQTTVNFTDQITEKFYKSNDARKFLIFFNNRGKEIIADAIALKNQEKPFLSSYQGIIEVHPANKK